MIELDLTYRIKDDIEFILEAEKINIFELSKRTKISRISFDEILKSNIVRNDVCEKFYSYVFKRKYRLNVIKEEILKEKYQTILFHGSKSGLKSVMTTGSRETCDFGCGFYLGESYFQALSFICDKDNSSIYSFKFDNKDLKIKQFKCDLDWMLTICYFRKSLEKYKSSKKIVELIDDLNDVDVIIAPIADNKMFYIMSQFTDGEINADIALHSLSASSLGYQYIFKSEKSLNQLHPIERYYISNSEREETIKNLIERSYEIDTKLKIAKREFKDGLYIEELLQ